MVHVFPNEKFAYNYIIEISKLFGEENNTFLIYGNNNYQIPKQNNIIVVNNQDLLIYLYKCKKQKLIFHSCFCSLRVMLPLILVNVMNKNKIGIVFWGADLYNLYKSKFNRVYFFLLKRIDIRFFLTKEDHSFFEKHYFLSNYNRAIYTNGVTENLIFTDKIFEKNISKKDIRNILICHSGDKSLNHVELMKKIKKINKEFDVYALLSYGDKNYIDNICEIGYSLFDNKFKPKLEYMNIEEYINYLSDKDALCLDTNRQIALGCIIYCVLLGIDIFVKKDSSLDNILNKELKLKVHIIENLGKDEKISSKDKKDNRDKIINYISDENFYKIWDDAFRCFES